MKIISLLIIFKKVTTLIYVAKVAMSRLLELAVLAVMSGGAAWCLAHCLDDEPRQVREGKKDPRTAVLPVLPDEG